jgi:murein DD-endopeptidase MepM/ murein hydrolase activator NlpD
VDGIAGPTTIRALRGHSTSPSSPTTTVPVGAVRFYRPVPGGIGDGFGPRGARFHAGLDLPDASGTPVAAAGDGVVIDAGWWDGGFGKTVQVAHDQGVTTIYAHLSELRVKVGQRVSRGTTIGLVGSTGDATGPHLHFEVRLRGASVDPATALD